MPNNQKSSNNKKLNKPNNQILIIAAAAVVIPILIALGLGYKYMTAHSQLTDVNNSVMSYKSKNHDIQNDYDNLNSDNFKKVLTKQGIIGTDVKKQQQNMTDTLIKNFKIAYSAKVQNDFNKLDPNHLSSGLIYNLKNSDTAYTQGSRYKKTPALMRQGIKDINVYYGRYNYHTQNVYALVNLTYNRYFIFDKTVDGAKQASPNDTYILKCNLKSQYADLVKYKPNVIQANKPTD